MLGVGASLLVGVAIHYYLAPAVFIIYVLVLKLFTKQDYLKLRELLVARRVGV